jgi:hypothetical protein
MRPGKGPASTKSQPPWPSCERRVDQPRRLGYPSAASSQARVEAGRPRLRRRAGHQAAHRPGDASCWCSSRRRPGSGLLHVVVLQQGTLGWTALHAGLAFVPWAATTALVAQVVSWNLHRAGPGCSSHPRCSPRRQGRRCSGCSLPRRWATTAFSGCSCSRARDRSGRGELHGHRALQGEEAPPAQAGGPGEGGE